MSNPMMGAPAPQAAKPNAISDNASIFNPSDAAMMGQTGQVNKGTTIADFITKILKVPLNAPVSALAGALKTQMANRNMAGKAQSISSQNPATPQRQPMAPSAQPSMAPAPAPAAPSGGGDRMAALSAAMKGGR